MNTTPEFIAAMRAYEGSHTEFAAHVRSNNFTPSAVKLSVPFLSVEREPTMSEAAYRAVRARNRARLAAPTHAHARTNQAPPPTVRIVPQRTLTRPIRDFGAIERVSILNLSFNALLDTGAQLSTLITTRREMGGTQQALRVAFTLHARHGSRRFERPVIAHADITGMHGARDRCPIVRLPITLGDYTTAVDFAIALEKDGQQAVILGDNFFAAAPFAARIVPGDRHRIATIPQSPPRRPWNTDDGE